MGCAIRIQAAVLIRTAYGDSENLVQELMLEGGLYKAEYSRVKKSGRRPIREASQCTDAASCELLNILSSESATSQRLKLLQGAGFFMHVCFSPNQLFGSGRRPITAAKHL